MKKNNKFWSPNFMAEFKKWMNTSDDQVVIAEGSVVNTNLNLKILINRMDCQESYDNSVIDVAKYFKRHGGTVSEINDEFLTIETKKGVFKLSKNDIILN